MVRGKRTLQPLTELHQNLKVLVYEFQEMTALPEAVKTPAGQAWTRMIRSSQLASVVTRWARKPIKVCTFCDALRLFG